MANVVGEMAGDIQIKQHMQYVRQSSILGLWSYMPYIHVHFSYNSINPGFQTFAVALPED